MQRTGNLKSFSLCIHNFDFSSFVDCFGDDSPIEQSLVDLQHNLLLQDGIRIFALLLHITSPHRTTYDPGFPFMTPQEEVIKKAGAHKIVSACFLHISWNESGTSGAENSPCSNTSQNAVISHSCCIPSRELRAGFRHPQSSDAPAASRCSPDHPRGCRDHPAQASE